MASDRASPRIAFLGLGLMGGPMARNLVAAGRSIAVWNRSIEKGEALASLGATIAATPRNAAEGADLVVTMLADGTAVTEVVFDQGVAAALAPGAVVIDMSSIPPALARTHAAHLAERKIAHLDAPVSGGAKGAAEATLAIMVGGVRETYDRVLPVFNHLGRATFVGPSGSGQLAKLANQVIVAVTIGAVAEALLLAAAGGADPAKVREALSGGFADSAILKLHGERMLRRNWIPGGKLRTQVKDLRTILNSAADLDLELPIATSATSVFEAGLDHGLGDYDHSALLLELERRNPGARVADEPDHTPAREAP